MSRQLCVLVYRRCISLLLVIYTTDTHPIKCQMDSFNPFANAWGDDNAASGPPQSTSSSSAFRFPNEEDRLPSDSDPLGFKSSLNTHTPAVVIDSNDDGDAWGSAAAAASQPVASTSSVAGLGAADEWYTAPSTPKPPASPDEGVATAYTEDSWQPSTLSPAIVSSPPPAWAIEGA